MNAQNESEEQPQDENEQEPPETPVEREVIFDWANGDFLGVPYIRCSTYQHSSASFIINDPNDTVRQRISGFETVEIECGFAGGFKKNKFVGKVRKIGRSIPDGCYVYVLDVAAELQQTTTTAVTSESSPAGEADSYEVEKTFEGNVSSYTTNDNGKRTASGEELDQSKPTAAHKDLPFKTLVRVTNTGNNKSVMVTINDRLTSGDEVLKITEVAAKELEAGQAGTVEAKIEVLREKKNQEKSANNQNQGTQQVKQQVKQKNTPTTPPASPSTTVNTLPEKRPDADQAQPERISDTPQNSPLASFVDLTNFKLSDLGAAIAKPGDFAFQQTIMEMAMLESVSVGDTVIARGETIEVNSAGNAKPSGVTIDYAQNRAVFVGNPIVYKRSNFAVKSGIGSVTVTGYDLNNKQSISATASTGSADDLKIHPTGVIQAPEWGSVKLSDPIYKGSKYTWGDATKNGQRVPTSKEVMAHIIGIAQVFEQLLKRYGFQGKAKITSWYRSPAVNRRLRNAASNSRHLSGDAIDYFFSGPIYSKMFNDLDRSWPGGVARGGGFTHIDNRHLYGKDRARWDY